MLKYKITTPPISEPVTLAEAKAHLRVLDTNEDVLIQSLISAAREYAESVTGRAFVSRTITAVCDSFPSGRSISLPVGPLISVVSVNYTDKDNNTFSFTDFSADTFGNPPKLVLNTSASWPGAALLSVNPIQIVYRAGFESNSDIPATFKQAILLLVGHWFEHREEVITGTESYSVPFAAEALLQQWRHPYT
ncbi:MAG: phage head-tail connector protein [Candidatus Riflebacteria bacterium]|nr:phage head-tail connector protein [Candidatus Riflebacteria bacterium]